MKIPANSLYRFQNFFEKYGLSLSSSLIRYFLVGMIVSLTQFSILITLVEHFDTDPTAASGIAFFIATFVNYILQHSWTFQSDQKHRDAFLRYCAVTSLTMCINLLLFWTLYIAFHLWYVFSQIVTLITIAFLNFLLNRHFTFNSAFVISDFRNEFSFDKKGHATTFLQVASMTSLAIAVRLIYVAMTSARDPAAPYTLTDSFATAVQSIGISSSTAIVISTFLPGVLMTIPVIAISRTLYDERIAWIAALFTILHPRMIEYSCNGASCMLPLLFFALGIAFWTLAYTKKTALLSLFSSGFFLGLCSLDSPGAILAFSFCCVIEVILLLTRQQFPNPLKRMIAPVFGFAFFLHFMTNKGVAFPAIYLNIDVAIDLLPSTLLSPIFLFAVILPVFAARKHIHNAAEVPLIVMFVIPLGIYILNPTIPTLMTALIPIHIFGAAGLAAFCGWLSHSIFKTQMVRSRYAVIPLVVLFILTTPCLALSQTCKRAQRYYPFEHQDPTIVIRNKSRYAGC